ncbi:aldehyde dehydrogenase family protein [Peptostreptococcaceae bacterium AGR-M142]
MINEKKAFFNKNYTFDVDFKLEQLNNLKKSIKNNEQLILDALKADLYKCEFEAYETELMMVYESINYFIKNLKKLDKPKKVKTPIHFRPSNSYVIRRPYGVSLIISPWNYPFSLAMDPLIGAIAGGNCAVIKPSEYAKSVSKVIKKIIEETFAKEYIEVIEGDYKVSEDLLELDFDHIFFTGSTKIGKIIMNRASRNLIPITLELGGKSPTIVHLDSDIKEACKKIVWAKFINCGQTCVAPDYVLVHYNVYDEFLKELKKTIIKFYGKNPLKSKSYSRIINLKHFKRVLNMINFKKIYHGGKFIEEELYIEPTVLTNVNFHDTIMQEEIFGPVLPVIKYEDIDTVINILNKKENPLALYVFTSNTNIANKVVNSITFGGGCINDTLVHTSNIHLPFGGVKQSGMGRYHGKASFYEFTYEKSIMEKYKKTKFELIYPPYNKAKLMMLKKLFK